MVRSLILTTDFRASTVLFANYLPIVLQDFLPSHSLTLSYPSAHTTVNLGNQILPSSVSVPPIFEIHSLLCPSSALSPTRTLASNTTYTLVLSDPDATSRANPTMGEMCHWIATGITLTNVNASSGLDERSAYTLEMNSEPEVRGKVTELMKYLPPSPPPKTGHHRYVFVLLAPEADRGAVELKKPDDRPHWGYGKVGKGVKDWAADNGLVAVGKFLTLAMDKVCIATNILTHGYRSKFLLCQT